MEKFSIEKDKIYNMWVVWLIQGNTKTEKFKSKNKKECNEYIRKDKK